MLEDLETLVFEGNQLYGELPACLTGLSAVFEFDVHNNAFSGTPPSGFLTMPRLETLDLSSNNFTGGLDFLAGTDDRAEPLSFSKLTTLRLDNNGFDGELPTEIYTLNALEELTLHKTAITGDISAMCEQPTVSILTTTCSQVVCNNDCCTCL